MRCHVEITPPATISMTHWDLANKRLQAVTPEKLPDSFILELVVNSRTKHSIRSAEYHEFDLVGMFEELRKKNETGSPQVLKGPKKIIERTMVIDAETGEQKGSMASYVKNDSAVVNTGKRSLEVNDACSSDSESDGSQDKASSVNTPTAKAAKTSRSSTPSCGRAPIPSTPEPAEREESLEDRIIHV
eukprot:2313420-Rhodomonas_salina.1